MTVEKINHLKRALVANIVGILTFLHKQNPGLIILEENQKERNSDKNIAGYLEWALYRKFQTEGLVPPYLKEVDFLLKEKSESRKDKIKHFGLIHFINPENTSRICPKCNSKDNSDGFKKRKKSGWFKCGQCGFNTRNPVTELSFLNNPDKLAAFNICKEGQKLKKELSERYFESSEFQGD